MNPMDVTGVKQSRRIIGGTNVKRLRKSEDVA